MTFSTAPSTLELIGTTLFGLAILHTFLVQYFLRWSGNFEKGSIPNHLLHLLSEIEVVFGLWASLLLISMWSLEGSEFTVHYQSSLNFTEPLFVFCIMVIAATRPLLSLVEDIIAHVSQALQKILRTPAKGTDVFVVLSLGPLLGSLITEPAAMTVTALLLSTIFRNPPARLAYFLMAVLFVNVSVGGALTPFAAPPLLMVASRWQWDLPFVFQHFGIKSIIIVIINALLLVTFFRRDIQNHCANLQEASQKKDVKFGQIPLWVTGLHLVFLAFLVLTGHHASLFMGIFLLFLGVSTVTQKYQDSLRLRESLLVGFFLAGIVVFGALQTWWLTPLLASLSETLLFTGATALTAITDNAALTYLGSQVAGLSVDSRYALVAGAIAGGGLTVIANAPNPAGYSLLSHKFPEGTVNPLRLFVAALLPTLVAVLCLWFLPR
jgi:MFS family permease